jgi:cell division protein FtsB
MFKNKLTTFVYTAFIGLLACQIFLTSGRATDGDQLAGLDTALSRLSLENERLKSQIYNLTSIDNIQKYARESRMVTAKVQSLGPVSVASRLGEP